ncbi:hypothetical protein C8J57DRAFT_1535501 [Mycena rebaudengoi]|nr:hypothetical protein C8J57DRAFT_1535501 [Mycena rebaudengoi]
MLGDTAKKWNGRKEPRRREGRDDAEGDGAELTNCERSTADKRRGRGKMSGGTAEKRHTEKRDGRNEAQPTRGQSRRGTAEEGRGERDDTQEERITHILHRDGRGEMSEGTTRMEKAHNSHAAQAQEERDGREEARPKTGTAENRAAKESTVRRGTAKEKHNREEVSGGKKRMVRAHDSHPAHARPRSGTAEERPRRRDTADEAHEKRHGQR